MTADNSQQDHYSSGVKAVLVVLYSLIAALGTCGNLLVVVVVLRKRSMQTITNILITNLAVSDIIMSTVNVPLTPAVMFMRHWTLPAAVCKLLPMTMGVSVYVSTLTSTAIAIDRYFVIVHPFIPRMKTSLCLLIVVVIWTVAVLISLPIAVFQKVQVSEKTAIVSCSEDWKPEYRPVFTVISFVLQFLVPCSVITVCYVKVSASLSNRYRNNTLASKSRAKEQLDIRRKRRTNRMLIAMVGIFVVCWIPLNLLWMLKDANVAALSQSTNTFRHLFFVCHMAAMSSVMYNPFLYGWLNANFQNEFKSLLPCLFAKAPTESKLQTSYRYSTIDRRSQRAQEKSGGNTDEAEASRNGESQLLDAESSRNGESQLLDAESSRNGESQLLDAESSRNGESQLLDAEASRNGESQLLDAEASKNEESQRTFDAVVSGD